MAVEHEVVIEFNKLLSEHVSDLWKIASGLIAVEILIIAHTLVAQEVAFGKSLVAVILFFSAFASVASLVFGYFAEAAALSNFQAYAAGGEWTPSLYAERFNLYQVIALTVAFAIFVLTFIGYSSILAEALTKVKT
jgi:hypothetical protein